jgi:hypothetical protein
LRFFLRIPLYFFHSSQIQQNLGLLNVYHIFQFPFVKVTAFRPLGAFPSRLLLHSSFSLSTYPSPQKLTIDSNHHPFHPFEISLDSFEATKSESGVGGAKHWSSNSLLFRFPHSTKLPLPRPTNIKIFISNSTFQISFLFQKHLFFLSSRKTQLGYGPQIHFLLHLE